MTINANALVNVTPGVIAPGGSNLVMNGLMLTTSTRIPIGQVIAFPDALAVQQYFGALAPEATYAQTYFAGYNNSLLKPSSLLMAQFPYQAAVSAYLRGGPTNSGTLAQINRISAGGLNITVDGVQYNAQNINFQSATSLSNAASILQSALQGSAQSLGPINASIAGTTLTVSNVFSGTPPLAVGQVLGGNNVTPNTIITGFGTGSGGVGTYTVSPSQTAASSNMQVYGGLSPSVTFDSISQAFVISSNSTGVNSTIAYPPGGGATATFLKLSQSMGAIISQGAPAAVIPTNMNAILTQNSNWTGFMTVFEPTLADKVAFAAWSSPLPIYYAMWDSNPVPAQPNDTSSAYYQITQAGYSGILPIYMDPNCAAFVLGAGASIDYNASNGRETLAYLTSSAVTPSVTDSTTAANLIANGYNFYGSYANQGNNFINFQNGSISGPFDWWDSYTNQIWLNNNLQTSLIQLLETIGNIPYNATGYALIRTALYSGSTQGGPGNQPGVGGAVGPIAAALNFGAIRPGVTLSANEVAAVNNAVAPLPPIDGILNQLGWYLQVADPGAAVRLARGSPVVRLFYMDGQSVQTINVSSSDVQ